MDQDLVNDITRNIRSLFSVTLPYFSFPQYYDSSTLGYLLIQASNLSQYLIVFVLCALVLFHLYIKLRYPFWDLHPVKHSYTNFISWWYWNKPPFQEYNGIIPVIKYYDPLNVITRRYSDVTTEEMKTIVDFLQCNLLQTDTVFSMITIEPLQTYLTSHVQESVISWILSPPSIQGVILSRPYTISIRSSSSVYEYDSMLLDYICINKQPSPPQKIIFTLLESHFINQSHIHPDRNISLFKNKADSKSISGISPLTTYTNHIFDVYEIAPRKYVPLPDHFICNELTPLTWSMFLEEQSLDFLSYPNLFRFMESDEYFCYCFQEREQPHAYYFFRKNYVSFESFGGEHTLELLGSYSVNRNTTDDGTNNLFYLGFIHCIRNILKKKAFQVILIPTLSDNESLLLQIEQYTKSSFQENFSYFLYNLIVYDAPRRGRQCMFL